jgi:hypothetical protein
MSSVGSPTVASSVFFHWMKMVGYWFRPCCAPWRLFCVAESVQRIFQMNMRGLEANLWLRTDRSLSTASRPSFESVWCKRQQAWCRLLFNGWYYIPTLNSRYLGQVACIAACQSTVASLWE